MYVENLTFIFNFVKWGQEYVKQTEPKILCLVFKASSGREIVQTKGLQPATYNSWVFTKKN